MSLRIFYLILLLAYSGQFLLAQSTGKLSGKVRDKITKEELIDAIVKVEKNNSLIGGTKADYDGNYTIDSLEPGKYKVIASYAGRTIEINDVYISADRTQILNIEIDASSKLEYTEIIEYKKPLLEIDNTKQGAVITSDEMMKMGSRALAITANSTMTSHSKKGNKYRAPHHQESYPTEKRERNNETYSKSGEQEFQRVSKQPLSTFSVDVDNASYTNVRRMLNAGSLPPEDAVRIEEFINYFSYQYPPPTQAHPFSFSTNLAPCPWNSKRLLFRIAMKAKDIPLADLPPMNLVFLVDVSGSMESHNKLPLLIKSLRSLTDKLRPQDKVAVVVYAGNAGLVLPTTLGQDKAKILEALNKLQAGGSTAGGAGIELAYKTASESFIKEGINRVILATDGDFNIGDSSDEQMKELIEEKRKSGISLTVLGFGMGNLKDSKMEILANYGNGNYFYIDTYEEAMRVLVDRIDGTLYTIAEDVKLQIEFNPAQVKHYRLIGYDNRRLEKEDFNNDKKDAGDIGAGHTVTAIYEIIPASSKEEPAGTVDPLKYSKEPELTKTVSAYSNEWLTVKFRYKTPGEANSKLITLPVTATQSPDKMEDDFKFSAAVTAFGLVLKDSEYKGNCNYLLVEKLASESLSYDPGGYRAEFIRLVKMAASLKKDTRD
jgi:Ca-activated chloride channel homolog